MTVRRWKGRLLALLEIVLALGIFTDGLALALLAPSRSLANPLGSVRALAAFTTLSSCLLLLLLALLLRLRKEKILTTFLGQGRRRGREAAAGIPIVAAIFLLTFALKSLFRHFAPGIYSGERNVLEELMRSPTDLVLFLFVALFTGGIKEEVQRAFVIRRFQEAWGPGWLGALLFAVYFGYGHRVQGWDEAILAGLLGLGWGLLFLARRSIVAPGVSHGLYDALELIRYYVFGPMRYF